MSLSDPKASYQITLPAIYDQLSWQQKRTAREQYIKLQHYECIFCGGSLYQDSPEEIKEIPIDWELFPENFTKYPVHLQHNHVSGLTEGAIHSFCNALIWNYYRR